MRKFDAEGWKTAAGAFQEITAFGLNATLGFIAEFGWDRQAQKIKSSSISTPAQVPDGVVVQAAEEPKSGDYVVSISLKSRHRCLHRVKSCFRLPGDHYKNFAAFGESMPGPEDYDAICQDCWKTESKANEDMEGDTSSSSEADEDEK